MFVLFELCVSLSVLTLFCSFLLQHEVIAVSEKVIVRLEDLVKWTVPDFSGWAHGLKVEPLKPSVLRELGTNGRREALHRYRESTLTSGLNFKDVQRERSQLGECILNISFIPGIFWGVIAFQATAVFLECYAESLCVCLCHKSVYLSCPLVGLTSIFPAGVIHQYAVGIAPIIMS